MIVHQREGGSFVLRGTMVPEARYVMVDLTDQRARDLTSGSYSIVGSRVYVIPIWAMCSDRIWSRSTQNRSPLVSSSFLPLLRRRLGS